MNALFTKIIVNISRKSMTALPLS